jgi:hypothetical protein
VPSQPTVGKDVDRGLDLSGGKGAVDVVGEPHALALAAGTTAVQVIHHGVAFRRGVVAGREVDVVADGEAH